MLVQDRLEVSRGARWCIDELHFRAKIADHLMKCSAVVQEQRPERFMSLDNSIQAELKGCNINLSENFDSNRKMMLWNSWSNKFHEPGSAL